MWYDTDEQRTQHNKSKKELKEKYKLEVFIHYSGGYPKCACCGEDEYRFLTLDHMDGGGRKHRLSLFSNAQVSMYRWLKANNYPAEFQILCYNCNCARQWNNGVCPHKES